MEEMDLSGHQGGILKLTCRTVIAPFKRVFGVKIVDSKGKKQENKQEGDVALFSVCLSHRIPCGTNIREIRGECQILSRIKAGF
jgi:hypothetical protein